MSLANLTINSLLSRSIGGAPPFAEDTTAEDEDEEAFAAPGAAGPHSVGSVDVRGGRSHRCPQ